jgi:hypothetical protein
VALASSLWCSSGALSCIASFALLQQASMCTLYQNACRCLESKGAFCKA